MSAPANPQELKAVYHELGIDVFKLFYAKLNGRYKVTVGLAYVSIILSVCVIVTVIMTLYGRDPRSRVSLRLAGSIALADIIYALVQIILYQNSNIPFNMSDTAFRFMLWLHLGSIASNAFLTTCIALHLHLTSVHGKHALANKIAPYFELISWPAGLIVAHPVMYAGTGLKRFPTLGAIFLIDSSWKHINGYIIGMYITVIIAMVYCLIVCIIIIFMLLPTWHRIKSSIQLTSPDHKSFIHRATKLSFVHRGRRQLTPPPAVAGNHQLSEINVQMPIRVGANIHTNVPDPEATARAQQLAELKRKRNHVRFTIIRILLYPIVLLVTLIVIPVYLLLKYPNPDFGFYAVIIPLIGGIINFCVFMANPALDELRERYFRKCKSWFKRDPVSESQSWKRLPSEHRVHEGHSSDRAFKAKPEPIITFSNSNDIITDTEDHSPTVPNFRDSFHQYQPRAIP
ncbi:hypothetical protein EV182_001622 [Spiromyces aspiralis]|uniref:Uncharacterized protein n=1 Tax=Spiromyces aspiralis TaxID=68401 RepID=A0ACC1HWP0_9FUNG|nr:hypothetical protein EV182_001622 [Spiromyces aspiralis]